MDELTRWPPLSATLASYFKMIVWLNQMQLHPNPLAGLKEPASTQRSPIFRAASQWSAKMTDDKPEKKKKKMSKQIEHSR